MRSIFLPFILCLCVCCNVVMSAQDSFTVMSYNVENLFDTIHDEGKNDYEFLPEGSHKWTRWRLYKKLHDIGKVIVATDSLKPCEIVGLCEVENDTVLTYLTEKTVLHRLGYKYIMTESADDRGIDVALLYSPMRFRLMHYKSIRIQTTTPTRDVLYASGIIPGGDTLDIYQLHLPSKLGKSVAERNRKSIINGILTHADSVSSQRTNPTIIIMGDFNDELKGKHMQIFAQHGFKDLIAHKKPGSYKYKGVWQNIDHILIKTVRSWHIDSGITYLPFLLEPDKTHGGMKPFRTFLGPAYHRGVSDHLPVWCRWEIGNK